MEEIWVKELLHLFQRKVAEHFSIAVSAKVEIREAVELLIFIYYFRPLGQNLRGNIIFGQTYSLFDPPHPSLHGLKQILSLFFNRFRNT